MNGYALSAKGEVERCDLRLSEALDQSEEARIDNAHSEIGIVALQLETALRVPAQLGSR